MSDEAAVLYLSNLQAHELAQPLDERSFLRQNNAHTDAFLHTYGYYAAAIAQSWYERNRQIGITLGACIRAANTGLIIASYRFVEGKPGHAVPKFKNYATPFIRAELDWLLHSTRKRR